MAAEPVSPKWRSEELHATKGAERAYEQRENLAKLFNLSGRVAFVTGAARGVGAAIAAAMAESGAKVVLVDVQSEKEMAPVAERIRGHGGEVLALQCDVKDREQVEAAVKQAVQKFGGLDIMVANAGILGKLCRAESVPLDNWREVMGTNVEGAYNCAAAAYPHMKKAGGGKIILTSSIAGLRGFGAQVPYCTSKGALLPLAKSLAVAWGGDNIQVNCLIPGAINTPFLDQVLNTPEKVNEILRRIPAGRLGIAEDMAGPAVFLASHASDYVTGTEVVVDGGGIQMPMLGGQTPEDFRPSEP